MQAGDAALPTLDALFEGAACGLLLTDADGTIRRVNRTFCDWVGHDAAALVGQRKLQSLLTMGGRIFHQTHWAPLLQMQGSVAEVKLDLLHRDGRAVPMMMNAVRREHGGAMYHEIAVFVAEDRHTYERELILARRRMEEHLEEQRRAQQALALAQVRLRLAVDAAKLFIWDVDPATGKRAFEDAVALLLGHPAPRPVSDGEFVAAIASADREAAELALSAAMHIPGQTYERVLRLNGVDGVQRSVRSTGSGVFDADGKLLQFVGVLQDVTEASRQRVAAEDRALFAEQMVGIVSHDLRNPLSAIQMGTQLLGRGQLTAGQHRVLGHISGASSRAQRLIADLLDFTLARVGQGLTVAPKPLDLHTLVTECVEELALAFPGRIIEHERVGEGSCMVDADRLVQLLGNLVANALAHGAPDRPIVVTSSIEPARFTVAVHNEGPSIPHDLVPELFEPMRRGNVAASGRSVGLGLFIVREIARAHGGEVAVQSSPSTGTTFSASFQRSPP